MSDDRTLFVQNMAEKTKKYCPSIKIKINKIAVCYRKSSKMARPLLMKLFVYLEGPKDGLDSQSDPWQDM